MRGRRPDLENQTRTDGGTVGGGFHSYCHTRGHSGLIEELKKMFQEPRKDGGAKEPSNSNQYAWSSRMNNELLPDLNTNKEQICGGFCEGAAMFDEWDADRRQQLLSAHIRRTSEERWLHKEEDSIKRSFFLWRKPADPLSDPDRLLHVHVEDRYAGGEASLAPVSLPAGVGNNMVITLLWQGNKTQGDFTGVSKESVPSMNGPDGDLVSKHENLTWNTRFSYLLWGYLLRGHGQIDSKHVVPVRDRGRWVGGVKIQLQWPLVKPALFKSSSNRLESFTY